MTFPFPILPLRRRTPSLSYLGPLQDAVARSTYTYTGASLGAASSSRIIAIVAIAGGPPTNIATSVTIGGVTATIVNNNRAAAGTVLTTAYAEVPTGTTGDIVIVYPSNAGGGGSLVFPYRVDGMISSTPASFSDTSNPFSQGVTCAAGSAIITGACGYLAGAGSVSWSGTANIVEDDDIDAGTVFGGSASLLTLSALTGETVIATPATLNAAQMQGLIFT